MFGYATLACSMVLFVTSTEAGIFFRRSSNSYRPTTYYRPATTTYSRPAAATPRPAAVTQPTTVFRPASAPVVQPATQAQAEAAPVQATAPTYNSVILNMLARNNAIRTSRGMRPTFLSSRLTAAAQNHANYMARTGTMNHYTNGGPQARAAMYGFRGGVRENIAMGQPSVDSVFSTWTASGGHYANMMSHSDVAGFGYAVGANGQPFWVAVYATNDGGN
jgi:uncharacterized protein YkwD